MPESVASLSFLVDSVRHLCLQYKQTYSKFVSPRCSITLTSTMTGNRRHIPRSTKENMVILSGYMKSRKIAEVLDVSKRTVNRVKRLSLDMWMCSIVNASCSVSMNTKPAQRTSFFRNELIQTEKFPNNHSFGVRTWPLRLFKPSRRVSAPKSCVSRVQSSHKLPHN